MEIVSRSRYGVVAKETLYEVLGGQISKGRAKYLQLFDESNLWLEHGEGADESPKALNDS